MVLVAIPLVYCDMVKDGGGWTNIDFSNNKVLLDNGHFVLCRCDGRWRDLHQPRIRPRSEQAALPL